MVKTAVQRKPNAPVAKDDSQDDLGRALAVFDARRQFVAASLSMGWQMAGMVIIPVVIGVRLDDHFQSRPSYTLAALLIAVCGAIFVANKTIQNVKRDQSAFADMKHRENKTHA